MSAVDKVRGGFASVWWIASNAHNRGTDLYAEFEQAAREDAAAAIAAVEALEAENAQLRNDLREEIEIAERRNA